MALRWTELYAICWAVALTVVAMGTRDAQRSGYMIPHSSTCIPPMDPPTTHRQRRIPSWSASIAWERTMSRIETTGNDEPWGLPESGCRDAGPVLPWHPPNTLAQT